MNVTKSESDFERNLKAFMKRNQWILREARDRQAYIRPAEKKRQKHFSHLLRLKKQAVMMGKRRDDRQKSIDKRGVQSFWGPSPAPRFGY
jgi:hypothetical protein